MKVLNQFSSKVHYESPSCETLEFISCQSILADSDTGQSFNSPENWGGLEGWDYLEK